MKGFLFAALALSIVSLPVNGQTNGVGVGITVGEPTGLTTKIWFSEHNALAGAVAWSFRDGGSLQLQGDYLIHYELTGDIQQDIRGRAFFHYGIGGRLRDDAADNRMSVRVPLGVTYAFGKSPLDFYFEIVPMLDVSPETAFDLGGAAGVRLYFGP